MSGARGLEIAPWRPGDEESICRLFRRTFGREKRLDEWRWQFLGQGIEPHVMLARDDDGEVVAHFGGVPRRVRIGDRDATFTVAVDSMVAPEHRAGLKRRGLFAAVVARWVEQFCERGPVEVGYGLANQEALRIGGRLLGYTPLAGATLLARRLDREAAEEDRDVEQSDAPPADHDALWERCLSRHEVAACRDARFMDWRYRACPDGGYSFLLVRRHAALTTVCVLKENYVVPDSATLVDLIWDGADPNDLAACVGAAEGRARAAGHHHLAAYLPEGSREAAELSRLGYRAAQMGLTLVARSFRSLLDLDDVARRMYFTCGDFDLV